MSQVRGSYTTKVDKIIDEARNIITEHEAANEEAVRTKSQEVVLVEPKELGHRLTEDEKEELRDLFLMDGITYTQAGLKAGVTPQTAKKYFRMLAEEVVEQEGYKGWVDRQRRVRARTLEGITKQIIEVTEHLRDIQTIYDNIIKTENGDIRNAEDIDHGAQSKYASQIRETMEMLNVLRAQSTLIQSSPPADIILDREIEKAIAGTVKADVTDVQKPD